MSWQSRYADKTMTAREAISLIPAGKHIFIASGAAEPTALVEELVAQRHRFHDNVIVHLLTLGPAPYVADDCEGHFRHNAFFIGANVREAVHAGRADYTPVFLSQIPGLIRSRRMPIDVALVHMTPPDTFGYANVGVSVDIVKAAIEEASLVIAEHNPRMPTIFGSGFFPMDKVDACVAVDRPLIEAPPEPLDDIALEIGRNVASLIADRSTLQVGIGQIPDATLKALVDKKDRGVWTEMFSDGVIDLIENGNITGRHKTIHPNKVSSSFIFGSQRLYDYVDRNPTFTFHASDYINDPIRIARQHKMVAINSALQIDLTGQVCADSIGTRFYSGIGGQVDFIRGASMCPGGKPIIAIRSTAKRGELSRIVATLSPGAGVVTSRGDVRFVVTEHGIADLQGKSIRERAMALISIAHPDFQAELLDAAKDRHYVFPDQVVPRAAYPRDYEREIRLEGQPPILLRPVRLTDEPQLQGLFYELSDDTIYRRWQRLIKKMPHAEILRDVDVDYSRKMGVVAEVQRDGQDPELVGVGQYFTNPATSWAEVAFVIRDDWQGHGLGTAFFELLIEVARDNGVHGFTAQVLVDNLAMLHVFHKGGLHIESTLDGNTYELRMPLQASPGPAAHSLAPLGDDDPDPRDEEGGG